jgi:hypothetical protein
MMQKGRLHVGWECSDEFIVFSMLPLSQIIISHAKRIEAFSRDYDVKVIL